MRVRTHPRGMDPGQNKISGHGKMVTTVKNFSGDRIEAFLTLKTIRRMLSKADYEAAVAELLQEEKLARRKAALEAAKAARAAKAALRATVRAELAAKMAAQKAKREAAKDGRMYAVTVEVSFTVRRKREDGSFSEPFQMKHTINFTSTKKDINRIIKNEILTETLRMDEESRLVTVSVSHVIKPLVPISSATVPKTQAKMKMADSLFLDGEEAHDFDSGAGTCVFDWIISRYGDVRGCKKVATMEALMELLGADAIQVGVSAKDLDRVCDALRCRQYALDETNEIIHTYTPEKLNNNVPPLVYRIKNGHIYPIMKEVESVCKLGRATNQAQAKAKKDEEEKEEVTEIVYLPLLEEVSKVEQMVQICKEQNLEVYGRGSVPLHYSDDGLCSFKLGGKLYMWENDEMVDATKAIFDMNGQAYNGETIPGMVLKQMNFIGLTEKSTFNPHVASTLSQARNRIQYGRLMDKQEGEWAADLIKCYSSLIMNPVEDWLIYDATNEWTAWDGELKAGLYFCETDDMRLAHGSNIYSRAMVVKAREAGIPMRVLYQLRPSKTLPRDYFSQLVVDIQALCQNDWSKMKFFFNILVGMLGKSRHTTVTARMDTDINTVWTEFNAEKSGKPFITQADGYYVYGRKHVMELAEHNLPMWIQILDWSNMKLFDLVSEVEATGGVLVGRKTDCAIFVGGSIVERLEVGGVRRCDVPEKMRPMKTAAERALLPEICETASWIVAKVTSSSEIDAAYSVLVEHRGMLMTGYAGTGKTYLAKKLAEKYPGEVVRIAPTNKAALNIGGRTIHKEFKIDMAGKFNLRGIRQKYSGKDVLFIVDEASMVGSQLWRMAVEVKKALPKSIWIILGDEGQCRPVAEEETDFFQSSMVRYLACGIKIHLTQIQRYDTDLAELALKVRTGQTFEKRSGRVMSGRHLCYFNRTRKWLNGMLNQKRGVFVEYVGDEEAPQDAWLYAGCPIIASKNYSKGSQMFCVNSEQFVIRSVTEEKMVVVSQRPEGEHVWELPTADFHRWFCLNFASTVHKAQGDTLEGAITIWDHEAMDARILYTAVTRAKKLDQIWFA